MSSVFFRSFESPQNPRVDVFKARKDFQGFKIAFSLLLLLDDFFQVLPDGMLQLLFIRVKEAVL